ncbi:hypothetical protein OH76DRAFT_457410 [Lentinus brumalis]|uniref:Uncharacterized protein n=1 Tax=Lentinus brumalis TaxID=2498619 RepID=A0A371DDD0_9APHY|nr:hypothetical protein OH76DRAFT_457410 [Polyporus brumalis]
MMIPSVIKGCYWRLDCLVACLGPLAGKSGRPLGLRYHALAHCGYAKFPMSLSLYYLLKSPVMGIMDTSDACRQNPVDSLSVGSLNIETTGTMFNGDVWGIAAGLSSLLTNMFATILIACRAWEHRRTIMFYLRARGSSRRTQVERTLALLVESGLLYCALWVFIVAYELTVLFTSDPLIFSNFARRFYYVMEGCVVPLIGMYPTLVLIVCAVNKSLHEMSSDKDGEWNAASIMFVGAPPGRARGTLSELLSAASAAEGGVAAPSSANSQDPQGA